MPAEPGAELAARRIEVERHGPGRLLVTISRRQSRAFSVSLAEAELLAGLLRQRLAEQPTGEAALPDLPSNQPGKPLCPICRKAAESALPPPGISPGEEASR